MGFSYLDEFILGVWFRGRKVDDDMGEGGWLEVGEMSCFGSSMEVVVVNGEVGGGVYFYDVWSLWMELRNLKFYIKMNFIRWNGMWDGNV